MRPSLSLASLPAPARLKPSFPPFTAAQQPAQTHKTANRGGGASAKPRVPALQLGGLAAASPAKPAATGGAARNPHRPDADASGLVGDNGSPLGSAHADPSAADLDGADHADEVAEDSDIASVVLSRATLAALRDRVRFAELVRGLYVVVMVRALALSLAAVCVFSSLTGQGPELGCAA